MSVAELAPRGGEFERTPPHDLAAEQCVLGGMLMSKDAISDVMEVISPHDHYRPAHQLVHEAILELYGRGEPADPVTVSDLLGKRGELARIGGGTYLHTLLASVPTAANAGYYARIVRERAILRRLVEAGTRIVQLGYTGDGDADELVDRAEAEIYGVTERRVSEDYLPLADIMPGALDEIEAIGSRGGVMTGVPTGFGDLDSLTNGLHPGQMVVIAARPAIGKALDLDTPLPTPSGWTTMGKVAVGEQLLGADGRPVTVVAATGVMHGRPCYEVEFCDGEIIVADGQHQWRTWTRRARRSGARTRGHAREPAGPGSPEVVTTEQIARTLRYLTAGRRPNHAVRMPQPLDLPDAELPFPPYALGAWLSSGAVDGAGFVTAEPEIVMYIEAAGVTAVPRGERHHYQMAFPAASRRTVQAVLRMLGVLGTKHIPLSYLRGSEAQRRALLAGILDTDGSVTSTGSIQLAVTNRELAEGVRELVASLGYRCSMRAKPDKGRGEAAAACYMVSFTTPDKMFWLERKHLLHKDRLRHAPQRSRWRYIVDVRPVPSRPVRCVQVDSADRLYLAGRSMIPTHNSTLALDLARAASLKHGLTTVMFSLEMSRNEITMRLLSAEARVPLHAMRTGQMGEDDWTRLARRMSEVVDAPLFIDDSPNMSLMEIRAKCRRLKQRHNLRLVIVDYLQLMSSPKRVENRQQEVSEMSRSLKLLAKELDVPVVAISQLNRGPEQRNDKRPLLSDLRESGCLTAESRILRADTGSQVTLGSLLASGERNVPVWALDERLRLIARPMTHVFSTGVKEVFRVRLASGREVEATANHPFLTYAGWRPLSEVPVGSRVAVPRHVPRPLETTDMPEPQIVMLAHLLGDGSFVEDQPIRYASTDEANLAAVTEAATHFGITAVRDEYAAARRTTLRLPAPYHLTDGRRNPIAAWLRSYGLFGLPSYEKFVPDPVFALPKKRLALFLRHLWATDGCVWWDEKAGQARIYYASTSRRLIDDVAQLLMRFNVMTRIEVTREGSCRPCYHLLVCGAENQLRFLDDIGVPGARSVMAERARANLAVIKSNANLDTIPREVWHRVRGVLAEQQMTHREFAAGISTQFCGSALWKHAPSRERLARIAAVLDAADLEMIATNDVFWDEVASVESLGMRQVYDATVAGAHNFIANGINVHNSIEQDSDVVILLHREDAYERESPRAGEADLIVAKHRNGPTAVVTVAFQGHYSRFVDMAPG
jgi:replicative DNA helicase